MVSKYFPGGLALAALASAVVSCSKPKEEAPPGESPEQPEAGAGGTGQPAGTPDASVPSTAGMSNFDAVSAHIDLGGDVFIYRDLEGSAEKAAKALEELIDAAGVLDPDAGGPALDVDLAKLVNDLGLTRVDAIGASSMRDGLGYINKVYVHTPRGRRGVLRLLGRDAGPFESLAHAPTDTDLLIERELNLSEAYRVGRDIIKQMKSPEMERSWARMMGQGVANFGVTVGDLFQKLDTRVIVIGRWREETIEIPAPQGPIPMPKFDLFVSVEGVSMLFDGLLKQIPAEARESIEKGEGFEQLALPPNPMMEAVLRKDTETGRVLFASSADFLRRCTTGRGGLTGAPGFKAATAGLPTEGNGMIFLSQQFGRKMEGLWKSALAGSGGVEGPQIDQGMELVAKLLPVLRSRYAMVSANLPDGVLTASNSPASLKQSMAGLPAAMIMAGVFSFRSMAVERELAILEPEVVVEAAPGAGPRAAMDMRTLQTALVQYKLGAGSFPTTEQGLAALLVKPDGVRVWNGPYLEALPIDPWGHPYEYRFPHPGGEPNPQLLSPGPDGEEGTGDDVTLD